MSEWKATSFKNVVNLVTGFPFNSVSYTNNLDDVKLLRGDNIIQGALRWEGVKYWPKVDLSIEQKYKLLSGDVVLAMDRPWIEAGLKYSVIKECDLPCYLVQRVACLRAKDEVDAKFLLYVVGSSDFTRHILSVETGTAVPHISGSQILEFSFLLPPLPEQHAIASVLSSLDNKIDLLHRQNKTLEAMAETLFRQWFVEEADEGWEEGTFEKWIIDTVGGEWGKESIEGDYTKMVNCIRGTDISDLTIGIPSKTPVRFVKEKKYESICPKNGDIILEISGGTENQSTGRTCYINPQIEKLFIYPIVFSNFCRLIRVRKYEYSLFLFCYFQYLYKHDEFFSLENGTSGIKNLNYKVFLFELPYPMPDEKKVIGFHKQVISLFQKIDQNKNQIRTLEKLRDTLLPKLMSGKVRVEV